MNSSSSAPGPAESILATLNTAQCRAVTSKAATVAILAGPGSGKTHTLTSRVVWLVDNVGYAPSEIIVATFTVKAAREMKERIGKALGGDREKRIVLGTFHSIARRYLAAYGKRIGLDEKFGIADDSDSRSIIQRICKRFQLGVDPPAARSWICKKKAKGDVQSPPKGKASKPESPDLETCYREYQNHLERSNLLDYDDLLTKCVELLRKHPSCVANVQAVLIDEYQDTNGIQYELMKLFAQARERITIVGDPDQSIYGWRSAEIKNLYRLLRDYPKTDEISLEENYRSSQAILDVSLKIIQQDKRRYQKVLLPIHNKGTRPVLRRLKSSAVEAEWMVSEIKRMLLMAGNMLNHDDVAILLRSASLSRHIESALGKAGLAYRMVGGFKFYDRAEVKVILDYLRVIYQPDNNDAVARIINVPRRGVGDATIKSLLEEAESAKLSVWSLLNKHCRGDRTAKTNIKKAMEQKISGELIRIISGIRRKIEEPPTGSPYYHLVDMIESLLNQLNFQKYLQENYPEDHEARWANVQEFISLAGDFMRDLSATADEDRLPEVDGVQQVQENDALGRFLANVSLASDAQKGDTEGKPLVTISTIHAAKGLEWPVVFVPAVYNGSIPHARSEDMDEERRLLYVAMTRAKSLLYLSCPMYSSQNGGNGGERTELSKFIPSEIHPYFRKRGPSFEPGVLQEVGRILGRESEVPSQNKVFGEMPLMERPEDNLYPENPEDSFGDGDNGRNRQWQRRPRPQMASAEDDPQAAPSWHTSGTATTMDAASSFTMSSLPGFTTATAAQSAIQAAAKEMAASVQGPDRRHAPQKSAGPRRGTTKRPADQQSLLGFVKRSRSDMSDTSSMPAPPPRQPLQEMPELPNLHRGQAPAPAIEPGLASHKLGANRIPSKPSKPTFDGDTGPKKHYANFSSSPPRPEKENEDKDVPPVIRERPASCLHATTTTNGFGGFKRPAALKKEGGIAPIDRLRKPFKPLTIKK